MFSTTVSRTTSNMLLHVTGTFELPKVADEHTSASYRKIEGAAAILIGGVVVIACVRSGLSVSTIFGSFF